VIPLREVRVLDLNAAALGVGERQLVERAGAALADAVLRSPPGGPVVVLAGPGNNGADGLTAARALHEKGVPVVVLSPIARGGWKTDEARAAAAALPEDVDVQHEPSPAQVEAAASRAAVVLDALLGAGIEGALRPPYDAWVDVLRRHARKVVAVDVPTGFGTATTFVPRETVTFHDIKEGMSEASCGRIVVADIGVPREAALYTGPGEYSLYPRGKGSQHKGEGGTVLVVGGGPYTGAPAVAGLAALRAGADLAIVLTPKRAWSVVASYSPNLVVRPLERDELDFEDPSNRVTLNTWMKKARSVVLGPGLGLFDTTQRAVHHVLERAAASGVPCVVDADALAALAQRRDLLSPTTLLTPHAREFKTLTGLTLPQEPEARGEMARAAAERGDARATWLVKGPVDVVTDGRRLKLNATGHPAMSVGGTGDALAGAVGALLAKGLAPFDAARVGARLVGEAGERAAARMSWGLVATDVVDALAPTLADRVGSAPSRT
jgi:NAD(P)H-hydrate epimerase